jgi:hypothetical protein
MTISRNYVSNIVESQDFVVIMNNCSVDVDVTVVILTSDATNNVYMYAFVLFLDLIIWFALHVTLMCSNSNL